MKSEKPKNIANRAFYCLKNFIFPKRCPFCNDVIGNSENECEKCRTKITKKGFMTYTSVGVQCVSPFLYEGIYSRAVKGLKFHEKHYYAQTLAQYIADEVKRSYGDITFDIVTSVPRYKKDNRKSKNCSKQLAIHTAKILGVKYEETLTKNKKNQKQHRLPKESRKTNVLGVFGLKDEELIKGKNVLICDDIITTGYTLGECCKVLKTAKPALLRSCALCTANKFRFG